MKLFAPLALVALALATPLRAQEVPIQHFVMVEVTPPVDLLAVDRWYITYHAPETLARAQNRQTRYVSHRSYRFTPEEAERLKLVDGRLTEIGFASVAAFRAGVTGEAMAAHRPTPPDPAVAAGIKTRTVTVKLPAVAIKDDATPDKAVPYARWVVFLRPPAGTADADAWAREALAPLTALPQTRRVQLHAAAIPRGYSHVAVLWYDDVAAWRSAMAAQGAALIARLSAQDAAEAPTRTMLVGERPDLDFRTDKRVTP
ncbi:MULTISPECIES: hypothetical protein [unclassified Sphingomonas]|uniref:hypothetical protein n=1 Tax=unclassified Sphingomonas TaxID=196159 RepID=UPI0008346BEF|nr:MULTISPECIES: hypothetical protein [unclassified Sphingomonas]